MILANQRPQFRVDVITRCACNVLIAIEPTPAFCSSTAFHPGSKLVGTSRFGMDQVAAGRDRPAKPVIGHDNRANSTCCKSLFDFNQITGEAEGGQPNGAVEPSRL